MQSHKFDSNFKFQQYIHGDIQHKINIGKHTHTHITLTNKQNQHKLTIYQHDTTKHHTT